MLTRAWDFSAQAGEPSGQLNPRFALDRTGSQFDAKFQVPTLRNTDMRPTPQFVKAYMHNGYFKSLKEVVHFYNTRDVLPRCEARDPRRKSHLLAGGRGSNQHQ